MKKSICLVIVLFGFINAKPSRFAFKQMVEAIESLDRNAVENLMNYHKFQKEPELMKRLLLCAHDVMNEKKVQNNGCFLDLLSLTLGGGGVLVSAVMLLERRSWHEKLWSTKLGSAALLAMSLYLSKRGIVGESVKKCLSDAQEIIDYLKKVQKGEIEVPAEVSETDASRIENVEACDERILDE